MVNLLHRRKDHVLTRKHYRLLANLALLALCILSVTYWFYITDDDRHDNPPTDYTDDDYPVDDSLDDDSYDPDNISAIGLFDSELSILILGAVVILGLFIALNSDQIKSWAYRYVIPNKGMHRLSMQDIFENSNRLLILQTITDSPGVHFNEIRRKTELAQGQLSWHLEILDQYGIINREEVGQYVVYFPSVNETGRQHIPSAMEKSKTTLRILDIIEKDPGITASSIGRLIGLKRNSVKYHIDKLIENDRIKSEKEGRINKLYALHQP
ncbi:MAG: winged helix-turn-helix transcriptional regulator [Promethearchaeota archaeon]